MKGRKSIFGWFLALLVAFSAASCKTVYVPLESNVETHYVDSVRWEIRDSIRITERSRYKDWTGLLDTLSISSARSHMRAWTDTTRNILAGELTEEPLEEKTRIVYRDREVLKDTTIYQQVPVEVEVVKSVVPRWSWWSLAINILGLILLCLFIYLKVKSPVRL